MAYSSLWHHYISWYGIGNNFFWPVAEIRQNRWPFSSIEQCLNIELICLLKYCPHAIHIRHNILGRDETRWKLSVTAEAYASPACSQLASILTHPATLQIFSLNRCRLVTWSSHCELDLISYQKCKKRRKKPTLLTVSVYPPPLYGQVFVNFFWCVYIGSESDHCTMHQEQWEVWHWGWKKRRIRK